MLFFKRSKTWFMDEIGLTNWFKLSNSSLHKLQIYPRCGFKVHVHLLVDNTAVVVAQCNIVLHGISCSWLCWIWIDFLAYSLFFQTFHQIVSKCVYLPRNQAAFKKLLFLRMFWRQVLAFQEQVEPAYCPAKSLVYVDNMHWISIFPLTPLILRIQHFSEMAEMFH